MSRRTHHPLKTLWLLVVVAGVAWGAYEFVYVRGVLRPKTTSIDMAETSEAIRNAIFDAYEGDRCLVTLDEITYRANQHHYRIRITISHECTEQARAMCEEIAEIASGAADASTGVFAYDGAGNLLAKFVQ